jgi:hypothetical protein
MTILSGPVELPAWVFLIYLPNIQLNPELEPKSLPENPTGGRLSQLP